MIDLSPLIERITSQVSALKLIGGAARFEEAQEGIKTLPAAFALLARESPEPSPFMDQVVQQRIIVDFVVLVACRNLSDASGKAAAETMQPVRHAIRQALLKWAPDAEHDGCEFVNGEMLDFVNKVLWWQDTYRTAYMIRSD